MENSELLSTMDAVVWTDEFIRIYNEKLKTLSEDEFRSTMLGWFANAIMTGYDHNYSKHKDILECKRVGIFRDIDDKNKIINLYGYGTLLNTFKYFKIGNDIKKSHNILLDNGNIINSFAEYVWNEIDLVEYIQLKNFTINILPYNYREQFKEFEISLEI